MEIVELVVEAEGDERGGGPGEDIAAVSGVVVPEAENIPDHQGSDVNWCVGLRCHYIHLPRQQLQEYELDIVEMPGGEGNGIFILVMLLVESVEQGVVHGRVNEVVEEIFNQEHDGHLRKHLLPRWAERHVCHEFRWLYLRTSVYHYRQQNEIFKTAVDDVVTKHTHGFGFFSRIGFVPGPGFLYVE